MAQQPPPVEVTSTGIKRDYAEQPDRDDPPQRSARPPLPRHAASVPDEPDEIWEPR